MFEDNNQKRPLYIPYAGPALLETPLLNKGSAFTSEERSSSGSVWARRFAKSSSP